MIPGIFIPTSSEMNSLSISRLKTAKNVQIDPQKEDISLKHRPWWSELVSDSLWHLSNYREAELLMISLQILCTYTRGDAYEVHIRILVSSLQLAGSIGQHFTLILEYQSVKLNW